MGSLGENEEKNNERKENEKQPRRKKRKERKRRTSEREGGETEREKHCKKIMKALTDISVEINSKKKMREQHIAKEKGHLENGFEKFIIKEETVQMLKS